MLQICCGFSGSLDTIVRFAAHIFRILARVCGLFTDTTDRFTIFIGMSAHTAATASVYNGPLVKTTLEEIIVNTF